MKMGMIDHIFDQLKLVMYILRNSLKYAQMVGM